MALADGLDAEPDRDLAVVFEPQVGLLVEDAAGDFEKTAHPASAQPAARLRFLPARGKTLPIGERQRLVHRRLELAAVVDRAVRRLVRHGRTRDEVAPA